VFFHIVYAGYYPGGCLFFVVFICCKDTTLFYSDKIFFILFSIIFIFIFITYYIIYIYINKNIYLFSLFMYVYT